MCGAVCGAVFSLGLIAELSGPREQSGWRGEEDEGVGRQERTARTLVSMYVEGSRLE